MTAAPPGGVLLERDAELGRLRAALGALDADDGVFVLVEGEAGIGKTSLLERHDAAVREQLGVHGGREVKTLGDGFLAVFDRPAAAVACALAIRDATQAFGLPVRAGLHAGEVEVLPGDVRGIAVNVAARVAGLATAGEVLLSATVRDLALGAPLSLTPHGRHALKGVPGEWEVLSAT